MALLLQIQVNLMLFLFLILVFESAPTRIALPGCSDRCGKIRIPYPFGIGHGCYLEDAYAVECRLPNLLLLRETKVQVLHLTLEGRVRLALNVSYKCKDLENNELESSEISFSFPRFAVSPTSNKLTGVGCGGFATMIDLNNSQNQFTCATVTNKSQGVIEGKCNGYECCQLPISGNISRFKIQTTIPSNPYCSPWSLSCHYAFLVEDEGYEFRSSDLLVLRESRERPVLFDWWVGQNRCREVTQEHGRSYACKSNESICLDSDKGPGYLCNCTEGYQGNPYLQNGCQDINECEDPHLNHCLAEATCRNVKGNYTCHCPKGYHGDGSQKGTGCTADQPKWEKIIIGTVIGLLVICLAISWVYWVVRKRRILKLREKFFKRNGGLILQQELLRMDKSRHQTQIFSAEELKKATENFHETRVLGQGGQGTVYKGILSGNRIVANKKAKIMDNSQIEEFINELVVLSQINHRNVVKLLGCCLETEVPLLVYEFVANGTLFGHIHGHSNSYVLPWETRLKIATETASAISYLHSAASIPIIHRDIKSTNILLDENYATKISDFGTSRLVPVDQEQVTTLVRGTLGYLDPEYFRTSHLTEKSDVYSFGVVLLELLTGKMALSFRRPESERHLVTNFESAMQENRFLEILDQRILTAANLEKLEGMANLAMECVKLKGDERPTMKDVAAQLNDLWTGTTDCALKVQHRKHEAKNTNNEQPWTV